MRNRKYQDMANEIQKIEDSVQQGEIILYQPDETVRLEVRLEDETVWLTQQQMAELFRATKQNISLHIKNVYEEGELSENATVKEYLTVRKEGNRMVRRRVRGYNLDVIISVGYRVKSLQGTRFRQWANKVLKDYLLNGYSVNQRFRQIEQRLTIAEDKIDFFVRSSLPPVEGVFYDGQIFDAYKLVEALVKSAKQEIILIDNYIDASVFDLLEKRRQGVTATIYTEHVGQTLLHLQQLNLQQYGRQIEVRQYNSRFHDRFLILDDALYHFGASFKDLGRRLFAFERMGLDKNIILNQL